MPARSPHRLVLLATLCVFACAAGGCKEEIPAGAETRLVALPDDLDRLDPIVADLIRTTHAELAGAADDPERWLRMAMTFDANEYDDAAAEAYAGALARDDTLVRAWYHQFRLESRLGRTDDALVSIARVIALRDDYPPAYWRRGQLLLDLGRFGEAETSFRHALALDDADPASWIGLARALVGLDRHEEATTIIEGRRAGAGLNSGYAHLILANAYRRLGRMDDAAAALEQAADAKPVWRDPWDESLQEFRRGYGTRIAEARALSDARRVDEAIAALLTLRDERPDNVTVLATLGLVYRKKGRLNDSLEILRRSLEIDANHFPSHFHLAVGLVQASRRPGVADAFAVQREATLHLDRALEINPTYAAAHSLRGDIHLIAGEIEAALARFLEAARCDPDDARYAFRAGITLLQLGRWLEAVAPLERTVSLNGNDPEAWRALAVARMNLDRYDEAEVALREGMLRSPNDSRLEATLAELQQRRGGRRP